ncbi:hypothetical protein [Edaphocola flava]|uniref:hypothetical protein n=1 Tax=Edaphocola flava TaxID=2499629 RepID=UPI00100B1585|nr:hypothetical protein [Edaphocola flava]
MIEERDLIQSNLDLQEALVILYQRLDGNSQLEQQQKAEQGELISQTRKLIAELKSSSRQIEQASHDIPRTVSVNLHHRFDKAAKYTILGLVGSLIITAISVGGWIATSRTNTALEKNDLKYRYLLLTQPGLTMNLDSLYSINPERFEQVVLESEEKNRAIQNAEALARAKEKETKEAQEKVEKLKK